MKPAVLVIDDEQAILRSIRRLLHRDNYQIHLASNGDEAIKILVETDIAVIICDQRMPGMSGAEVLTQACKIRPDAYRITLTGFTDLEAAQRSINEGQIHQFLTKPWQDDHLRLLVAEGVRAHQLIQENRRLEQLTRQQNVELQTWNKNLEEQVQQRTKMLVYQNKKLLGLQEQLEHSLRDTVGVMASMLEMFSPALGIHCKRVAELAGQIGTWIEVDQDNLRDIELAAHLHDIGKIATLAARNRSPGRSRGHKHTTSAAYPEAGHTILARVVGFENIAQGIRYQKVPFDGDGSAAGMKGDMIPLVSRIIAVASAYDDAVFSSTNPTDPNRANGRRTLLAGKGKTFDPKLVQIVLDHLRPEDDTNLADTEVELSPRQLRTGMVLSRDLTNIDGVLLLKSGIEITPDLINRVRVLCSGDLLLSAIYVKCTSMPAENKTGKANEAPAPNIKEPNSTDENGNDSPPSKLLDRKKKVLLVDDVQLVCNSIRRQLFRCNFDIQSANDGQTALEIVKSEDIDLVITDLAMVKMSGESLVNNLQRIAPHIPCIVLTGEATKDRVIKLSQAPNVRAILTKPWESQQLLDAINNAFEQGSPNKPEEAA